MHEAGHPQAGRKTSEQVQATDLSELVAEERGGKIKFRNPLGQKEWPCLMEALHP